MKCPYCDKKIGLFSKTLNKFGKEKTCPECGNQIKLYVSMKIAALLFIPAVLAGVLLRPVFESAGLSGSLAVGVSTGILVALAMRLKKVEA